MNDIYLYNSRTRKRERFCPIDPGRVRLYVCGPTVYDRAHIGNARPVVVFDVLYRLLRHVYGSDHVIYVRNITDIDDKIMVRAKERDVPIAQITETTSAWFMQDMAALGALEPTHQPRATAYVAQMITMIEALIARGHAYHAEGHVLFEVATYSDYGALSGRSTEDMIAGARVEIAPYKRDPMDFVLWKPSAPDQPGWDSPWGRGRPGWHIECSAMSLALLGTCFDIHGGGADLMFPHHENEIAQSCCASGQSVTDGGFARYWLHNGMINVDGRKMSKSLGNFLTVAELRDQAPGEVLRLVMLGTHYRKVLDWTQDRVDQARAALLHWHALCADVEPGAVPEAPDDEIIAALANDLNISQAISHLHGLARQGQAARLLASARFLGLLLPGAGDWAKKSAQATKTMYNLRWNGPLPDEEASTAKIEQLLRLWAKFRDEKDFAQSDALRDDMATLGIALSVWRTGEKEATIETSAFDRAGLDAVVQKWNRGDDA